MKHTFILFCVLCIAVFDSHAQRSIAPTAQIVVTGKYARIWNSILLMLQTSNRLNYPLSLSEITGAKSRTVCVRCKAFC